MPDSGTSSNDDLATGSAATQDASPSRHERPAGGLSVKQVRMIAWRMATLGTELAASTLIFAGIGYAVDRLRGHDKLYATALGTLIGFSYGMFRFIQQVRSAGQATMVESGGRGTASEASAGKPVKRERTPEADEHQEGPS